MRHMCRSRPEMVSTMLIKEYLIGTPYQSVKNKNMELHLLSLLPVTSLESFTSDNLPKKIKRFMTVTKLNMPFVSSNRRLSRRDVSETFLFKKTIYCSIHICLDSINIPMFFCP